MCGIVEPSTTTSLAKKEKLVNWSSYNALCASVPILFTLKASPLSPFNPWGIAKVNLLVTGL